MRRGIASDGGQRRARPLDGDQVGDDLNSLGRRLVGVGPAGDLVGVVADARRSAGCARAPPRPPGRSTSVCDSRAASGMASISAHPRPTL